MVILNCRTRSARPAGRRRNGSLLIELAAATTLLVGALLPLAYSMTRERHLARATYQRAVAMEIVDGEAELLAAGGWKAYAAGRQPYPVTAQAVTNLPAGNFWLTVMPGKIRLEWQPEERSNGGSVTREVVSR